MNDQPRDDAADKSRKPLTRNKLMLMWFAAILVVAVGTWLGLVLTETSDPASATFTVAGICVFLAAIVDMATRSKRRSHGQQRFQSPDDLRKHVDSDALRTVRDRDGEVRAIKELRRQMPGASLADATHVVRGL